MQLVHPLSILLLLSSLAAAGIPSIPKPVTPAKEPNIPKTPESPESPETPDSPDSPDSPLGPGYKPSDPVPNSGGTTPNKSPSEYSVKEIGEKLSSLVDAITSIYDAANPSTSAAEVAASQPTITAPADMPVQAAPCSSAHHVYDACASANPGFNTYSMTDQASCLCSVMPGSSATSTSASASETVTTTSSDGSKATSTVAQALFDGYMSSCDGYVQHQTQLLTYRPAISQGAGLCARVTVAGQSNATGATTAAATAAATSAMSLSSAGSAPTIAPPTTGQAGKTVDGSRGLGLQAWALVLVTFVGCLIL